MYMMGIINSRRLGRSLGLDIIGADGVKRCNMNCVYCEVGNGAYTKERGIYSVYEDVKKELISYMDQSFDVVTFSGNGEPTLNSEIGRYIDLIHSVTNKPVCVITNASLLDQQDVVDDLNKAEIVMPSIDAVSQKVYDSVDRGFRLDVNQVKQSLKNFANQYQGRLYVEALIVKGYNDSVEDLGLLSQYLKELKYDEFHLNTVDRMPAEDVPLFTKEEKEKLVEFFQKQGVKNIKIF